MTNWQSLADKQSRVMRRLMRGEGKSLDEIDQFFQQNDSDTIIAAWNRYQSMTRAERDRLFAAADRLRRQKSKPESPVPGPGGLVPGRGKGKVPAGVSFTLVLPPDLLDQYRQRAFHEQRSVAQLIRLAMLAYFEQG